MENPKNAISVIESLLNVSKDLRARHEDMSAMLLTVVEILLHREGELVLKDREKPDEASSPIAAAILAKVSGQANA